MKRFKREKKVSQKSTMSNVTSLFDLASNVFVRHVNVVKAHMEVIPSVLYNSLLKASLKTDRVLSTRHLYLSWPLQKLCLVNCEEFTEQYAVILAHSLCGCNMLREVDLTGCNIGVRGTALLLMLAAGRPFPSVTAEYCSNEDTTEDLPPHRLSITTSCYVSRNNYQLFLDVLEGDGALHDFTVSHFYAIELGLIRIKNILEKLGNVQAGSVIGIDLEMNSLPELPRAIFKDKVELTQCYGSFRGFSNLQYLNLSMNLIKSQTIYFILKHISAPLTHLLLNNVAISGNSFLTYDFNIMAQLPSIWRLEHLELESNCMFEVVSGLMELLQKCSETLSFLSLEKTCLTDFSIPELLQLLEAPFALETLRIGQNKFTLAAEQVLFKKDKDGRIEGYSYSKMQLESD